MAVGGGGGSSLSSLASPPGSNLPDLSHRQSDRLCITGCATLRAQSFLRSHHKADPTPEDDTSVSTSSASEAGQPRQDEHTVVTFWGIVYYKLRCPSKVFPCEPYGFGPGAGRTEDRRQREVQRLHVCKMKLSAIGRFGHPSAPRSRRHRAATRDLGLAHEYAQGSR